MQMVVVHYTINPETEDFYTKDECAAYLPHNAAWIRHRRNYIAVTPFLKSWDRIIA